jgi:tetratricopeptide (TPR) repeat protein
MGDYNNAIRFFEKAYNLAPNDKKINVFAKAYIAFVYANKLNKAKIVADELKKANATQFLAIPPKTYSFNQYIPYKTKSQVEQAKQLIAENKYNEALIVLDQSLNIYDSHIANRIIGEIYLKEQQIEQADFYFNKVNKWFKFDPDFLYDFALVYLAKKDYVNANKCLQEITSIDPEYKKIEQLRLLLS